MKLVIKLEGVHPYDGSYTVDLTKLSNRDYHDIKRVAGYTPPEIEAALVRGDMDMIVAFTIIGLRRSGRFDQIDEALIWDATADNFDIDAQDPEGDVADPPTTTLEPATHMTRSGEPSPTGGDKMEENHPSPTGMDSLESAGYVRKTLAS